MLYADQPFIPGAGKSYTMQGPGLDSELPCQSFGDEARPITCIRIAYLQLRRLL